MPLLHKKAFVRKGPPTGINPTDKVFYCELTNEAFSDYDEYWERLVLCNAMVWTCEMTGRPNLTYQEAVDSEAKGLKFLQGISKHLKIPMLYSCSLTRRGRQNDMSEDVFTYMRDRYFPGEPVEAIVKGHWYDCEVVRVITPTLDEITAYEIEMASSDEEDDAESISDPLSVDPEAAGTAAKPITLGVKVKSPGSKNQPITLDDDDDDDCQVIADTSPVTKPKASKAEAVAQKAKDPTNYPPFATYKYEVQEVLAWDYENRHKHTVSWEQIRRTKNAFTRDKCKLFLKVSSELTARGFWEVKKNVAKKFNLAEAKFNDFFPGSAPKFPASMSRRTTMSPRKENTSAKTAKVNEKKTAKDNKARDKKEVREESKKSSLAAEGQKKGRPSLSNDIKVAKQLGKLKGKTEKMEAKAGDKKAASTEKDSGNSILKHTVEVTAEQQMQMMRQRQAKLEQMREQEKLRLEQIKVEVKQGKAIKKEKARLLALEVKEYQRPMEDQDRGGHRALPSPVPVACAVPNEVFGEFLSLLEFINTFSEVLELNDVYPHGITFEMLEAGIAAREVAGVFNDVLQLLLGAVFSLQEEEDEEITQDKSANAVTGKAVPSPSSLLAAMQSANAASLLPLRSHNSSMHQLPLDALTLTEVLRIHLLASGADCQDSQWRHLNRGGFCSRDDPGLQLKLEQPELVEKLQQMSVFDMLVGEKLSLLQTLMQQMLTYAGVRDRIEESFDKVRESRLTLREHQANLVKMEKVERVARVAKRKEDRQKVQEQLSKKKEQQLTQMVNGGAKPVDLEEEEEKETEEDRLEREEDEAKCKERARNEHSKKEREFVEQIMSLTSKVNPTPLGMDRAFRRYWVFASVSGLFVEDDEAHPGVCCDFPTATVSDISPEHDQEILDELEREATIVVKPELAGTDFKIKPEVNGVLEEKNVKKISTPLINGTKAKGEASSSNDIEEKANTSDKENSEALNTPNGKEKKGAFAELEPEPKSVLGSAKPLSSKKTLKPTNIVLNGPCMKTPANKNSSKNQSITKFFSKSPKVESPETSKKILEDEAKTEVVEKKEDLIQIEVEVVDEKKDINDQKKNIDGEKKDEKVDVLDEKKEVEKLAGDVEVSGLCTADPENCTVHTTAKTTNWYFYHKLEDIDALIEGLNEKGLRENELKDNLVLFRNRVETSIKACPVFVLNPTEDCREEGAVARSSRRFIKKGGDGDTNLNFPIGTPIDHIMELTLRDMLLEVEEKLFIGGLGVLRVSSRDEWRDAIHREDGDAKTEPPKTPEDLAWAGAKRINKYKTEMGLKLSEHGLPGKDTDCRVEVRSLCVALLQVAQCIEPKYLKAPLAETEKLRIKREKAEKRMQRLVEKRDKLREHEKLDADENKVSDDSGESDMEVDGDDFSENLDKKVPEEQLRLPLERWEASLMSSVSFSQIFLHLATLDNSVLWSRSLTKTRCRVCRKGSDHDKMLLCDGCDKGHHIYCLKPKLKSIPEDDWFCQDCKPKLKPKSPRKKSRQIYVEEEQEESGEEEAEEEDEDDEENYEDELCADCGEDGELVCCDTCPAGYHAGCAGLKKVPRGVWSCPKCVSAKDAKEAKKAKGGKRKKIDSDDEDLMTPPKKTAKKKKKAVVVSEDEEEPSPPPKKATKKKKKKPVVTSEDEDEEPSPPVKKATSKRKKLVVDTDDEDEYDVPAAKKKRLSLDASSSSARRDNKDDSLHPSALHTLIKELKNHRDSWPFLEAVTKKMAPDYHLIIKRPMDLGTMLTKLNNAGYLTDAEFIADAQLVFENCQQYNEEDSEEYRAGEAMAKLFKKRAKELGLDFAGKKSRKSL